MKALGINLIILWPITIMQKSKKITKTVLKICLKRWKYVFLILHHSQTGVLGKLTWVILKASIASKIMPKILKNNEALLRYFRKNQFLYLKWARKGAWGRGWVFFKNPGHFWVFMMNKHHATYKKKLMNCSWEINVRDEWTN